MPSRKAMPPDHQRCEYTTAHGRRCTNPQDVLHHPLCDFHHRTMLATLEESRLQCEQTSLAEDILPPDQPLDSAQAVNAALTRVFRLLAAGRITPRLGASLGYVGQLVISTLPGVAREAEARSKHPVLGADPDAVFADLARALRESLPADQQPALDPGPIALPSPEGRSSDAGGVHRTPHTGAPASGFALNPEPDSHNENRQPMPLGQPSSPTK